MRLSAIDCLRRGFTSLRANWELVAVRWINGMVLAAFLLLGLVFPLLVLGIDLVRATAETPEDAQRLAAEIVSRLGALTPALLASLVGTLALWTFACVLYCWVQAGIYGVLVAADRQAPPALPSGSVLHGWFRTFNRQDFFGWGGRYLGRFFGLLNLFGALALGLALLALVWIVFIIAGAKRWGGAASLGIGCGGALPIGFLCLVLGLWFMVSQADLAREGSGVFVAARTGLRVLGARLGAVLLFHLLFFIASVGITLVALPVSLLLNVALRDDPLVHMAVRFLLFFLQSVPQSVLALALGASLVALVRGEARGELAG